MPLPTSPLRLLAPLALAALLATGAGCGDKQESTPPPASDTPSASESVSETPSESPSASETPSETPSETTDPSPPAIDTLLLPATGLPGFNDTWKWAVKGTGPQKSPFGICQRFPMETLGADETVVRRYRPAGDLTGGTGGHLVSRFVDDKSAAQTVQVLQSWHDRCKDRLTAYAKKTVGRMTTVQTSTGTASWYLVTYVKAGADEGRFDALGILRDGSTVEMLLLNLQGQDYGYPSGKEPMVQALKNAADRLGG
jgi:hypothetical protein